MKNNNGISRRSLLKAGSLGVAGLCLGTTAFPKAAFGEEVSKQPVALLKVEASLRNAESGQLVSSSNNVLSRSDVFLEEEPRVVFQEVSQVGNEGGVIVTAGAKVVLPEEFLAAPREAWGVNRYDGVAYAALTLDINFRGGVTGHNEIRINKGIFSIYTTSSMAFFNGKHWGLIQVLEVLSGTIPAGQDGHIQDTGWDFVPYVGSDPTGIAMNGGMVGGQVSISGMTPYIFNLEYFL